MKALEAREAEEVRQTDGIRRKVEEKVAPHILKTILRRPRPWFGPISWFQD